MRQSLLLCLIFISAMACNDQPTSQKQALTIADPNSGIGIEPALAKTDSLQILYYDDPDGDSLRYTRFFTFIDIKDSTTINSLLANLQERVERQDSAKECRSEGKIYLYDKRQEPLKTIYFSTRCDTCCYLYFIKEGAFYYSKLSDNFRKQLSNYKQRSHKP